MLSLMAVKSRCFWQEVRRMEADYLSLCWRCLWQWEPACIVELWAGKFKNLFTSSNPNSSHLLAQALVDLEVSVEDLASLSSQLTLSLLLWISWSMVSQKESPWYLTTCFCSYSCFEEVHAPVFTCLVRHEYMPPVFREAGILKRAVIQICYNLLTADVLT